LQEQRDLTEQVQTTSSIYWSLKSKNQHFDAHRTYNVDESGLTVVTSKVPKVLSLKGMTSAERGSLIIVVVCMTAGGTYVPPKLIFPRKNFSEQLVKCAPPGTILHCLHSGWINMEVFCEWLDHFIATTKPSRDSSVLLILDGHYSHTRNLELIARAQISHVTIVRLPPHSTHNLQPLDKTFM
jgi:hypothetical protein